ncbi:aldehyde dehydrogenase, partial [Mesorhizobium sp. M2D.F.Ca.ET.145.01.1.1]
MSLSFDPDTIPLPVGHFIGGELIPAGGVIGMRRPSDGKSYTDCPVAGPDLIERAADSAKAA